MATSKKQDRAEDYLITELEFDLARLQRDRAIESRSEARVTQVVFTVLGLMGLWIGLAFAPFSVLPVAGGCLLVAMYCESRVLVHTKTVDERETTMQLWGRKG